ncbi:uncharacterized protein PHACADRAFT_208724 [Phanerochaete carnosa HHB-10118-sp]|uniref:Anaphase-promoting complex subunit 4 WD40 domain-containing protein n=1 Tax=Phanerochaete carnosa (strain HHB-10118-sp) TaxID=650164 RepID=K5WXJ4_PHACS|nr:uncharacterized protein PHACADRAFT_208724 [Phanerochaete carnosa HHB-10118-sp]EKM55207.1 hypothetical protein PHACADRAFT_208724 [Phanerochaete carnosa HHB-10118-sp]
MLAVCTTASLVLLDPPTLKKAPSTVPPTCTFSCAPATSCWASDNSTLFVVNDKSIQRYDPMGALLSTIPRKHPVTALVSKDKGDTLIAGIQDQVSVLDANSGKIAFSLETHSGSVSGLALSPDGTLLASTSGSVVPEVHVHNLSGALSHVELQNLPRRGDVTACTFHPHSKSKLLVAVGSQLLVYDIAKPNAPAKTVQLDRRSGEIAAITCSPFSRSLVAVGCNTGVVNLVDLDKEKGLFRTIPLEARLSSLVFSPEGAALYAGTDDGKLLILDLRALDKPARSICVGGPVVCISVQRKLKLHESSSRLRPSVTALSKRKADADATEKLARPPVTGSSAVSSPTSVPFSKSKTSTTSKTALSPGPSPGRIVRTRTISATSTPSKSVTKPRIDNSKSTPPEPKSSGGSAAPEKGEEPPLPPVPLPMRARTVSAATSASSRATASSTTSKITRVSSSTSATSVEAGSPRTRKISSGVKNPLSPLKSPSMEAENRSATPAEKPTSRVRKTIAMLSAANQEKAAGPSRVRPRTVSTTSSKSVSGPVASNSSTSRVSAGASASTSTVSPTTAKTHVKSRTQPSRSSVSNVASRSPRVEPRSAAFVSPVPPVPPLPEAFKDQEQLTGIDIKWTISRTPSPDPHDDDDMVNTPVPLAKRNKGKGKEPMSPEAPKTNVLGLGTPELKRWIQSEAESRDGALNDDADGHRVEFLQVPANEVQIQSIRVVGDDAPEVGSSPQGEPGKATVQMMLQISPRRSSEKLSPNWTPIPSLFSPSRTNSMHGPEQGASSSSGAPPSPAHELLQSLVRDAMYDFRRETKSEIIGLHLDLVRMGRGWRKELRETLESWSEELKEIRRENELLRQENERLRRGY